MALNERKMESKVFVIPAGVSGNPVESVGSLPTARRDDKFNAGMTRAAVLIIALMFFVLSACGAGNFAESDELLPNSEALLDTTDEHTGFPSEEIPQNLSTVEQWIYDEGYLGNLVVFFDESLRVRFSKDSNFTSAEGRDNELSPINDILAKYPSAIVTPTMPDAPEEIEANREHLEELSGEKLADWNSIYHIKATNPDEALAIYRQLHEKNIITKVYPEIKPNLTGIPTTPSLTGLQEYLFDEAKHGGLNAQAAWSWKGQTLLGEGVFLFKQEYGLNPYHKEFDLVMSDISKVGSLFFSPSCVVGFPFSYPEEECLPDVAHGTAVAGILIAKHDNVGISGFAPKTTFIHADSGDGVNSPLLWGTKNSGYPIEQGSVWLIEHEKLPNGYCAEPCPIDKQKGALPIEADPEVFDAIKQAAAYGVTVVIGAGQGQTNLDDSSVYVGDKGKTFKDLSKEDAGSIVVGASEGGNEKKAFFSNCGKRVNGFAWGSGVVTTSYPFAATPYQWNGKNPPVPPNGDENSYYTDSSGGTSAAAAMVAGSAALVQSYARKELGYKRYLMPLKMREILVNSGVPQKDNSGCNIGKQPRVDVALSLVDTFLNQAYSAYPELKNGTQLTLQKMIDLRKLGVGMICKVNEPAKSDPLCPEEEIWPNCVIGKDGFDPCPDGGLWPVGKKIAKDFDFDGDGRADLVQWTNGTWKLDLSTTGGADGDHFGAWDVQINYAPINGKWVWPYVADMNSDGRTDFVVYDKEHGKFYIRFTTSALLEKGEWNDWDWVIDYSAEWKDDLKMDPWKSNYSRPAIGDYDGDKWNDIAIACSDGVWRVDYGKGKKEHFAGFEKSVKYLTDDQLKLAPGWAYPVAPYGESLQDKTRVNYKIPDGLPDVGKIFHFSLEYPFKVFNAPSAFGGNDTILVPGFYEGIDNLVCFGVKDNSTNFNLACKANQTWPAPKPVSPDFIYGDEYCRPLAADFDGDGIYDRAVMCPDEWKIAYSSPTLFLQNRVADTSRRVPLGYDSDAFTLPGRSYSGGVSYSYTKQLIETFQTLYPNTPPPIPVDMITPSSCVLDEGC